MGFCWNWSQGENKFVHCHYGWHGVVCVATTILSYFLFGNKIGTWPIIMDFLYSPNLNNFAKAIHNVVFSSPFHSRGIGLEGEAYVVFVKVKLHGNSHRPSKGIYTINIYPWQFFHLHPHNKVRPFVHSILGSRTQCWWHQLEHLIWKNSH